MTLGPKVLASRMVSEYVTRLYTPAAESSRVACADDFAVARDLAVWKGRVAAAWPGVAVEHVEASGVGDAPSLGAPLHLRAHIRLGDLSPDDVLVQVVYGRVDADDRLVRPAHADLAAKEGYDGSRWLYSGDIALERTGPFGYTVRVLPRHEGMVSPVEMGLLAVLAAMGAPSEAPPR